MSFAVNKIYSGKKDLFIDPFNSIVTTTKKNNRYYGPTESQKMASFLSEVKTDLNTIFDKVNELESGLNMLASGYLEYNEMFDSLDRMKRETYELGNKIQERLFIEAEQPKEF